MVPSEFILKWLKPVSYSNNQKTIILQKKSLPQKVGSSFMRIGLRALFSLNTLLQLKKNRTFALTPE
jgi:hypothetical protein